MKRGFRCRLVAAIAVAILGWASDRVAADQGRGTPARGGSEGAAVPTPRTADGEPDMSGVWGGGGGGGQGTVEPDGDIAVSFSSRGGTPENFERDSGIRQRMGPNFPLYKPQYWEKVQTLDINGNKEDPTFICMPAGVPRMGAPSKIVQTPKELIFLYANRNTFRVIPIDGRPHPPEDTWEGTWLGHPVGHWEGDTMVIESVGFGPESWLDWPGYFHSENMRVIERMTREGNTIRYQSTVTDPDVLMQPWVRNPITMRLNPNPDALLAEDLPCSERDRDHIFTKERG